MRNTAVTYRLTYQGFRAAGQVGLGGYGWNNSDTGIYQGELAPISAAAVDGVVSYAENAVSLSNYGLNAWPTLPSNLKFIDGGWFITSSLNGAPNSANTCPGRSVRRG